MRPTEDQVQAAMRHDQPMTRDEFYKRFPHFSDLPSNPFCQECLLVSYFQQEDGWLLFHEGHNEACSHESIVHRLYQLPELV